MTTGEQPLQFDTAIPHESLSPVTTDVATVTCVSCQTAIAHEYFDVNGQSVCVACREQLSAYAETPRGLGVFVRAGLFGAAAAIAGAILYYAVVAITNFEIGLVAIAIGYMVGYAVRRGTKGRGGRRFQVLALVLTYWAVGLAYVPFAIKGMSDTAAETRAQPGQAAAAAEQPTDTGAGGGGIALGLAMVVGAITLLLLMLPVLAVASTFPSGLISAAIIGFGMHQAWRMTATPALEISGPYKIAPAVSTVV